MNLRSPSGSNPMGGFGSYPGANTPMPQGNSPMMSPSNFPNTSSPGGPLQFPGETAPSFEIATKPKKEPLYFLFLAILVSIAAVSYGWFFASGVLFALLAWGLGVLAIIFISLYLVRDTKNAVVSGYCRSSLAGLLFPISLSIAFLAVIILSVLLGLAVGRW